MAVLLTWGVMACVEQPAPTAPDRGLHPAACLYDAQAISHTLPSTVDYFSSTGVSVTMKNTGFSSWSGSNFTLREEPSQPGFWLASTVGLGGATVDPGESHTFNFTIYAQEPEYTGYQDNYYQMHFNGTCLGDPVGYFGDANGRVTYVNDP